MEITIHKSTIVKPALDTPRHIMWLNNLDLVCPSIHTPTIYFFKQNLQHNGSIPYPNAFSFEHVRESLSKALVTYYPVAGRIHASDQPKQIGIDCNGEGVLVIEATTNVSLNDFGKDFEPDPRMNMFMPQVDYSQPIFSQPLLIMQVTWLNCGAVCVGVGLHHALGDGLAALQFLNFLGGIARGVDEKELIQPFFDRSVLNARDPPMSKFEHLEYQTENPTFNPPIKHVLLSDSSRINHVMNELNINENDGDGDFVMKLGKEHHHQANGPIVAQHKENHQSLTPHVHDDIHKNCITDFETCVFSFTQEQVNAMKIKAIESLLSLSKTQNDQCSATLKHITRMTTFQVMSAHLWKCITLARGLEDSQISKLYVLTDGRARLQPKLPEGYFGNVIFLSAAIKPVGDLLKSSLGEIASFIGDAIRKEDNEYLRSAIDYLQLQPNISALRRGPHLLKSPNLGIVTWTRLPVYGLDFGWGDPVFMGLPKMPYEGQAILLPAGPPGRDTRLRLNIALTQVAMVRFRELVYNF